MTRRYTNLRLLYLTYDSDNFVPPETEMNTLQSKCVTSYVATHEVVMLYAVQNDRSRPLPGVRSTDRIVRPF